MDHPIHHLHISHNTPCLPPPSPSSPQKCISIVFFPSWDHCSTPIEIIKKKFARFGRGRGEGANKVSYGRRVNGDPPFLN